jgi:hypothetical protein
MKMNRTVKDWLGLLLLLAVPLLMPWAIGRIEPIPRSLWPGSSPPAHVETVTEDASFHIEALVRFDGRPIHGESSFARLPGAVFDRILQQPLHARGHTQRPVAAHLWAFMQGTGGEVYMQAPALMRDGDAWIATNLRVGWQVTKILFVELDDAAHASLQAKAAREDWAPLAALPTGARVLGTVVLR